MVEKQADSSSQTIIWKETRTGWLSCTAGLPGNSVYGSRSEAPSLTCFFLYSISCERPNTVATAPPLRIAVLFRTFLNAMAGPEKTVKCGEEAEQTDPGAERCASPREGVWLEVRAGGGSKKLSQTESKGKSWWRGALGSRHLLLRPERRLHSSFLHRPAPLLSIHVLNIYPIQTWHGMKSKVSWLERCLSRVCLIPH